MDEAKSAVKRSLISIIITTKNEEGVLEKLLQSIKKQTYPKVEIIVVDNNSSDKTPEIAKKYTNKVYNFGPERSSQRNFGAKKAKGEYLLFLDADMELSPRVVEECVSTVNRNDKTPAATILEEPVARNFWERTKAFERSFYNLEGDELTDAARFFKKDILLELGGYDERITGPEDWDLTERLKKKAYKVGTVKAKILHYERIPSLTSLLKKKYYYGLRAHRYLEKQKVSPVSAKTIYFLRPVFYKNWKRLVLNPTLTAGMFFMLTLEMVAGGLGYLVGKARNL